MRDILPTACRSCSANLAGLLHIGAFRPALAPGGAERQTVCLPPAITVMIAEYVARGRFLAICVGQRHHPAGHAGHDRRTPPHRAARAERRSLRARGPVRGADGGVSADRTARGRMGGPGTAPPDPHLVRRRTRRRPAVHPRGRVARRAHPAAPVRRRARAGRRHRLLRRRPHEFPADAVSYLASALLLSGVRAEEQPRRSDRAVRHEVVEGMRFVTGEPVLRRIAVGGALVMAANGVCAVGMPLYLVKELGLGSAPYGLLMSAVAVGSLAGAMLVARVTVRFGPGRSLYGSAVLATVLYLPALATGPGWPLLLLPVAGAMFGAASSIFGVALLSYRQRVTPGHLLGRVNASMRFLMWGAAPLGGLAGGALGEWLGGYAAFATGIAVMSLAHLAVATAPAIMRRTATTL
ncbi:MFS transporter [Nonomuraea turkmeniaca]|uniref:MFS transporter n=1 Tax=Nonomuraea turkmeniaca TaxID=103838 RepID=A0A5S4F306_9ACTN|nr:MFS transporter [Nonomuraea turkmeniaca]